VARRFLLTLPGEIDPEVGQEPSGVIISASVISPVLVWSQQNYEKLLKTVKYFESI